jgi:parvulin-like peptidyl-prolyl isomerase
MADKNKIVDVTRKQLVGVEKDRAYNRILLIITAIVVITVLGLVSWALIQERIIAPRTIVAIVEGEEITGREFQSRVRANRQQNIGTYIQLVQDYQIFGTDPSIGQQILSQLQQIQFQLTPASMGSITVNQLVDDRIIILEAEKLGISVSEADVDKELEGFFGYYPNGEPTATATSTLIATSTLSETQLAFITLTPSITPLGTVTPSATAEESVEAESTSIAVGTEVPTATSLPTATPYTSEGYEEVFQNYLDIQKTDIGLTEEDLRSIVRANLYRNALFELVTQDVASEEEQVWARHILVETEEQAIEIIAELENGAEWVDLTAEHSLDPGNAASGGDLGWFAFTSMVEPFAEAAFDLDIGEISEPVESNFGWHIIQALGHELRPLSRQQVVEANNRLFQDYVQSLRNDYEWEISETWFDITPDDPDIPIEYRLAQ